MSEISKATGASPVEKAAGATTVTIFALSVLYIFGSVVLGYFLWLIIGAIAIGLIFSFWLWVFKTGDRPRSGNA